MRDERPVGHQRLEDPLGARDHEGRQARGQDREVPEGRGSRRPASRPGAATRPSGASHRGAVAAPAPARRGPEQEPPDVGGRLDEPRVPPELRAAGARRRHRDELEDAARGRGEDQHPVRQEHRLVDVVRHEQDRLRAAGRAPGRATRRAPRASSRRAPRTARPSAGPAGSWARALAMLTRWSMPPESWCGRFSSWPAEPELPQEVAGREARPPRDPLGEQRRRPRRASRAGPPAAATRARAGAAARAAAGGRGRSGPRRSTGDSRSATIRRSVVLPQPDGPTRATNSPAPTSRSIASSASVSPKRRETPRIEIGSTGSGSDRPAAGPAARPDVRRTSRPPPGQRLMPGLNPLVIISSAGTTRGI